jgi:hypothetical protein
LVIHEHAQKIFWQKSGQVNFFTQDNPNPKNTTNFLRNESKRECVESLQVNENNGVHFRTMMKDFYFVRNLDFP